MSRPSTASVPAEPAEPDPSSASERRSDVTGLRGAPRWFDLSVVTLVAAIAAVGVAGLALGLLGVYRTWAALLIGAGATSAVFFAVRPSFEEPPVPASGAPDPGRRAARARQVGAVLAIALAVAYTGFAGALTSQNAVVTRDPGSYANTAVWLANTGTLEVDTDQGAFEGVEGLKFDSAAVYAEGSDRLEFQFNHLASAVLAVGYDLGGYRLMYRLPALAVGLGLLAVYAVSVRVLRRPYLALVAPALLAATMPLLYLARNTYSEPFTLALLWGSLLLVGTLHGRPRPLAGAAAGFLLGSLIGVRVDSLAYIAMCAPLAAISIGATAPGERRRSRLLSWLALAVVTVVVGAIGWYDLVDRTGEYAADLVELLSQLRLFVAVTLAASVVGALVWTRWPALRHRATAVRNPAGLVLAVLVVVVLGLGWFVRPLVETATTSTPLPAVEVLQRREGLPIEPARTYYEDSLRWSSWYLGAPALLAAIAGVGVATRRFLRGTAGPWEAGVVALGLGVGAIYWWDPSITPDHLWAMRRFMPAVIPALCVTAALSVAVVAIELERRRSVAVRSAVLGVVVAAVLVPPVLTSVPLLGQRDQSGYLFPVLEACEEIGPDGAAIVIGNRAAITLTQTLRSWCDVPVAAQGEAFGPDSAGDAARLAATLADRGYELFIVADSVDHLSGYLEPDGPEPISTDEAVDEWAHAPTLLGAPEDYLPTDTDDEVLSPFALHLLPVEPAGTAR